MSIVQVDGERGEEDEEKKGEKLAISLLKEKYEKFPLFITVNNVTMNSLSMPPYAHEPAYC